jgi:hypothetical protein
MSFSCAVGLSGRTGKRDRRPLRRPGSNDYLEGWALMLTRKTYPKSAFTGF